MAKVYWTGMTKSGCVGQYSNCFEEDTDKWVDYEIINNKLGGACVGATVYAKSFIAKALPCDYKLFLGCQSTNKTIPGEINTVNIFNKILTDYYIV